MSRTRTVFSQLLDFIPKRDFRRCVDEYDGNYGVRSFTCWDQFLCMSFAQLTSRESLRDIEVCLRGMSSKLYRCGFRGKISKSTLADANEKRDSRIYRDFCLVLIERARKLYCNDKFLEQLDEVVYVLDSTYISLCLSLAPWAAIGAHPKGVIKVHTLLDLRGSIPSFIAISSGKYPDNLMLDQIIIEPGAFYVMDKAYIDFARLYRINQQRAYFVTRSKANVAFKRQYSRTVNKEVGLRCDQVVKLSGRIASKKYIDQIRRIRFATEEKTLTFLTNNFDADAYTITELYKARWNIEVFFKWIKQHLRITKFYGNSLNAIETQIWIAVATYLMIAIAKKELNSKIPLYTILQFLSLLLFEEMPILQAFQKQYYINNEKMEYKQLKLFDS